MRGVRKKEAQDPVERARQLAWQIDCLSWAPIFLIVVTGIVLGTMLAEGVDRDLSPVMGLSWKGLVAMIAFSAIWITIGTTLSNRFRRRQIGELRSLLANPEIAQKVFGWARETKPGHLHYQEFITLERHAEDLNPK